MVLQEKIRVGRTSSWGLYKTHVTISMVVVTMCNRCCRLVNTAILPALPTILHTIVDGRSSFVIARHCSVSWSSYSQNTSYDNEMRTMTMKMCTMTMEMRTMTMAMRTMTMNTAYNDNCMRALTMKCIQ